MFQITDFTEARLATVTTRIEKHGDDDKPAVSLGLEFTVGSSILDLIDPTLRPTFYKTSDTKALPGIDDALTVLRCNSVERVLLPTKHEGWTLAVDDGIDDTRPMVFGGVKCDKFSVEPKQGGTIVLRLRLGTSDLDAARSGMLGMHVGRPIWVTLIAPKPGDEKNPPKGKAAPDATDLFAGGDEGDEDGEDDPDPAVMGGARTFEKAVKAELSKEPALAVPEVRRRHADATSVRHRRDLATRHTHGARAREDEGSARRWSAEAGGQVPRRTHRRDLERSRLAAQVAQGRALERQDACGLHGVMAPR